MNNQQSTSILGNHPSENLVGEGGEVERSEPEPGEGASWQIFESGPLTRFARKRSLITLSRKGRGK